MINLIQRASNFADRTAITTTDNDKEDSSSSSSSSYTSYTYSQLLDRSKNVATHLLNQAANVNDLQEDRIAFLIPSSFDYVAVQWGIWRAGGIVVPLCDKHPLPSIQYVLDNARVSTLVYDDLYSTLLSPLLDSGSSSSSSSSSSSGITFINYSTIQQPKSTTNITLPTIHLDRSKKSRFVFVSLYSFYKMIMDIYMISNFKFQIDTIIYYEIASKSVSTFITKA